MVKAGRFQKGLDFYSAAAPILKTLTRDKSTLRCRDIQPGESVKSIFDHISGPGCHFGFGENLDEEEPPKGVWYDEADAVEDSILFPDEASGNAPDALVKTKPNRITQWEEKGPDMDRFVNDLDTDEEFDDEDEDYDDFSKDDELTEEELHSHLPLDPNLLKEIVERAIQRSTEEPTTTECLLDMLIDEDLENYPWPEPDPEKDFYPFIEREQSKGKQSHTSSSQL